jgi:hypothetical protein
MAGAGIGSSGPDNLYSTMLCQGFLTPGADTIRNLLVQSGHPSGVWPGRQIDSIGHDARIAGFHGADSMPAIATDPMKSMPSIVPSDIPTLSDDECLRRLAEAVEAHDTEHLDEVALLIGRLAVTIE